MGEDRNEELFRTWLREYQGILSKVASSFTSSAADRDDLIQEILIRIWVAMPSFQGKSRPSTWIYRVALNRAISWQRDESRRRGPQIPLVEPVDTRESKNAQDELLKQVYAELRQLNEIDRSLIMMFLDGCTYLEMSEVMGMTESNVGVRLNRAKKTLSKRLAEHSDER